MAGRTKKLAIILGDQLQADHPALQGESRDQTRILMVEVASAATRVPYHKKKLVFLFSAMRHRARELERAGWSVDYVALNDPQNTGTLSSEIRRGLKRCDPEEVVAQEPSSHEAEAVLREAVGERLDPRPDNRFLTSQSEFADWAKGRKQLVMEHFYREVRRKTGLLMEDEDPAGGKWNFDTENRKPPKDGLEFPAPPQFEPDEVTADVISLVGDTFPDHMGAADGFGFAVTREQAGKALDHFITHRLASFGDYQDAMLEGDAFMSHSLVGLYLNTGLLDPLEVCRRAENAWRDDTAPLNAVEGFIRQIIGWREFIRGIYWRQGPGYGASNFFDHHRDLPDFFWTGETDMACLKSAIGQTMEHAYAHHIQRLMVTGNFALLAGVDPSQVDEWYLAVYADAYPWVEQPNVLGMSQFADGGLFATKPYVSGGNYINKMSDYCKGCAYDVRQKTGEGACPFNYLYWDFLARHEDRLGENHRLRTIYSTWGRMDPDRKKAIRASAGWFLKKLENEKV